MLYWIPASPKRLKAVPGKISPRFSGADKEISPEEQRRQNKQWIDAVLKTLDNIPTVIGRDPRQCQFTQESVYISRRHAQFFRDSETGFSYVQDLGTPRPGKDYPGSKNGTWYIDGSQLIPTPVNIGSTAPGNFSEPAAAQVLKNGDFIAIAGQVFPIDNLKPSNTCNSLAKPPLTRCDASLALEQLYLKLLSISQGVTPTTALRAKDSLQLKLLLNDDVRADMYYKLRQAGLSAEESQYWINRLKRNTQRAMQRLAGIAPQLPENVSQSIMGLNLLKQMSDAPDDFSDPERRFKNDSQGGPS